MRQYINQHKVAITIAFTVVLAMSIQYLRISHLDISFLYDVNTPTFALYFVALIGVSMLVLLFVFTPMFLITEITYKISLPNELHINVKRVVYNIQSTSSNATIRQKQMIVLRC